MGPKLVAVSAVALAAAALVLSLINFFNPTPPVIVTLPAQEEARTYSSYEPRIIPIPAPPFEPPAPIPFHVYTKAEPW